MKARVLTHRRGRDTTPALRELISAARATGVTLHFDAEETAKHELETGECVLTDADAAAPVDLCLVLGGDGTILAGLRMYLDSGVPVFAVNFGEIGFLATMDPNGVREGFLRAFRGDYETLELPAITVGRPDGVWSGLNDISLHRTPGQRVAELAYAFGGEEIGRVRCDGLVVATPAGSTGYNLANGGPVLAWGVEGFVVSFIAPHSFTARALVVAPGDVMTIQNTSTEDAVDVHVDGRPAFYLPAHQEIAVEFGRQRALLAQLPGASFYHRLAERFGRLAR